jgi:hypothetical protein
MVKINYVSSSNLGYLEFAKIAIENFIDKFRKTDTLHFQCLDMETYTELDKIVKESNSKNVILYEHSNSESPLNPQGFNSEGFIKITREKFQFLYSILINMNENEILHFFDADVYFFKSPEGEINRMMSELDLCFQQDAPITDNHLIGETYVCSGNFSIRKTEKSLKFIEKISNKLNPFQNEQEVIYEYLKESCEVNDVNSYKLAKISVYDPELFQNGFDSFRSNWHKKPDKICIHANHMVGIQAKINAFRAMGILI